MEGSSLQFVPSRDGDANAQCGLPAFAFQLSVRGPLLSLNRPSRELGVILNIKFQVSKIHHTTCIFFQDFGSFELKKGEIYFPEELF